MSVPSLAADPRRTPRGFSAACEASLLAEGIGPEVYELWISGFTDSVEGLRFDGSPDALFILDFAVYGPLGEGIGGKVIRTAMRIADELELTLVGNPCAARRAPAGALAQEDLEAWYARLGFEWEPDRAQNIMARAPGAPVPESRRVGFGR